MPEQTTPTASTTTEKPATTSTVTGPVSVYIQNSMDGSTIVIKDNVKK